MRRKLLIVDDNAEILDALRDFFEGDGMEIFVAKNSAKAVQIVQAEAPNVALVDINLPGKSGLEFLQEIKEIAPRMSVIIMTGERSTQHAIEAMKLGAYDYLTKPLQMKNLETVVNKAFQHHQLTRDVRVVNSPNPGRMIEDGADVMIGFSPEMIEIWKIVGKIANADATVLIQGDSGTGKELLARSIYLNSSRKNKPFMAVNCAAIPEKLLESELFGHEKGAFTDADRRHIGRFEQCNGGTIFLDEIGEMSLENQAKLLRVVENQEFERVGGNETIKVDVRMIAATNRSLITSVKEKKFRLDLFYRLRVVNLFLPPLRERLEDIPLLVDFFVRRFAQKSKKPRMTVAPATMKLLSSAPWPGNIRELKNVIESAIILAKGETLLPEDFEQLLNLKSPDPALPAQGHPGDLLPALKPWFDTLACSNDGKVYETLISEVERVIFGLTMARHANNEARAAKFLGISRNTLRQRLAKYKA